MGAKHTRIKLWLAVPNSELLSFFSPIPFLYPKPHRQQIFNTTILYMLKRYCWLTFIPLNSTISFRDSVVRFLACRFDLVWKRRRFPRECFCRQLSHKKGKCQVGLYRISNKRDTVWGGKKNWKKFNYSMRMSEEYKSTILLRRYILKIKTHSMIEKKIRSRKGEHCKKFYIRADTVKITNNKISFRHSALRRQKDVTPFYKLLRKSDHSNTKMLINHIFLNLH